MKSWQVLFKEGPIGRDSSGAQGGSTSDEDFDDDADAALVAEGEKLLSEDDEENDEEEDLDPDTESEQSQEDQDDEEEEEEQEEDEQELEAPPASGFKFKDPKTGDFDFKRINKAVGGPELEKAFKEQTATITRTFQEKKALEEQLSSPALAESKNKAGFLDHLMATHPGIRQEVLKVLHGQPAGQNQAQPGALEIPGINPEDPLAPVVQQLYGTVQALQNRLQGDDAAREQREYDDRFVSGLRGARATFKELIGREANEEELKRVAVEMQKSRHLNGALFVNHLFGEEIRKAAVQKALAARKAKKNLPKTGVSGRRAPEKKGKRKQSREETFNELWDEHVAG